MLYQSELLPDFELLCKIITVNLRRIASRLAFGGPTWDILDDLFGIKRIEDAARSLDGKKRDEFEAFATSSFNKIFGTSLEPDARFDIIHELMHEVIDPGFYDRGETSNSLLEGGWFEVLIKEYQDHQNDSSLNDNLLDTGFPGPSNAIDEPDLADVPDDYDWENRPRSPDPVYSVAKLEEWVKGGAASDLAKASNPKVRDQVQAVVNRFMNRVRHESTDGNYNGDAINTLVDMMKVAVEKHGVMDEQAEAKLKKWVLGLQSAVKKLKS